MNAGNASAWWLATASVLLSATAGAADKAWAPAKKLDTWFDTLEQRTFANGAIAISEDGELKYERAVGNASMSPPVPIDSSTRFSIGPLTQLFTAVLTLQLAEKASITLDNKLAEFYPDLPNALQITYRDLLEHRSGLADYTTVPGYASWRTRPRTPAEILKLIGERGARFAPGERVEYSASNYLLLGYVLEKVYEKPYAEVLRQQITDRIGLSRTSAGKADLDQAIPAHELSGNPWNKTIVWAPDQRPNPALHGGAGAIVSTPINLVRYMDALFTRRLLSAYNLDSLRGQEGSPGICLANYTAGGQAGFGAGGVLDGYWAVVYYFPEKKLSVAFTTSAPLLPPEDILDEVFAILFERGHQPRSFQAAPPTAKQQKAFAGSWRWKPEAPPDTRFRRFADPNLHPLEGLQIVSAAEGLVLNKDAAGEAKLIPLGGDDFVLEGTTWYLRFSPRSNELVIRDYDRAYYFTRAE